MFSRPPEREGKRPTPAGRVGRPDQLVSSDRTGFVEASAWEGDEHMSQPPLIDQARHIITAQLRRSQLKNLDRDQYVTILAYVAENLGVNPIDDITDEQLDAYLDRVQCAFDPTRCSKVKVVLQIFRDWKANRRSSSCPGIVVHCPYCGSLAALSDGSGVPGYEGREVSLYVCSNYPQCDAYVDAHPGDKWPRGTLANAELRHWRTQAQRQFDRLWQDGVMSRLQADRYLQNLMGTKPPQSHIDTFTLEQCQRLIARLTEG